MPTGTQSPLRRFGLVLIVAVLVPIVPFAVIGELPGERWLSSQDDSALLFGLMGAALLIGDLVLPIPSSIVGTMLGARLGFLSGSLFTFAGLLVGHVLGYALGHLFAQRDAAQGERTQTPTALLVFASRPIPVLAEALTFTAGATGLGLGRFVLWAGLGDAAYALAMAGNGASLLPGALLGPGLIVPMALPVVGYAVWRFVASRRA